MNRQLFSANKNDDGELFSVFFIGQNHNRHPKHLKNLELFVHHLSQQRLEFLLII